MRRRAPLFVIIVLYLSCGEEFNQQGVIESSPSLIKVKFDVSIKPFPEIPFPNDLAARPDSSSLTGIRLNLPEDAPTIFERRLREYMNTLDGFSTYGPITIPFTGRIDIERFYNFMNDSDPWNDPVYVININKNSPAYGRVVQFDIGNGYFPLKINPKEFYPFDRFADAENLLFPDSNTAFINGEWKEVNYYDFETNTLILRPIIPLDQGSTYVVVLTKNLRDTLGNPVGSPFPYINHPFQNIPVKGALEILESYGVEKSDVMFAFSFTTQSITRDLEIIRKGLDGEGVLAYLKEKFPPRIKEIDNLGECDLLYDDEDNVYILQAEFMQSLFEPFLPTLQAFLPEIYGEEGANLYEFLNFSNVDYFVFGKYESPMFYIPEEGRFASELSSYTPRITEVTFMISVPKKTEKHHPPFPVVLFGHGYMGSRIHGLIFANIFAKYGIAVASIDAFAHGPDIPVAAVFGPVNSVINLIESSIPGGQTIVKLILSWFGERMCTPIDPTEDIAVILHKLRNNPIVKAIGQGRAYDVDRDGIVDSGMDYFTGDLAKTAGMMKQTLADMMLFVRILESLTGTSLEDGDFNGDGVLDIGGEDNEVYYLGQSMGGIHGGVLMGVEPLIKRAVLNVPGGGLLDIGLRTDLTPVIDRLYTEMMGPVVVGGVLKDNFGNVIGYPITLNNNERGDKNKWLGELEVEAGEVITVINYTNGEVRTTVVDDENRFAVNIPSDPGDLIEVKGKTRSVSFKVPYLEAGMGYERNSKDFRASIWTATLGIDSVDPINYAVHYNNYKEGIWSNYTLEGVSEKDVLIQVAVGDTTVPTATGVALARASGFITLERNKLLIKEGIVEGLNPPFINFDLFYPPEDVIEGSGFRLHMAGKWCGRHEYLAIPVYNEDVGEDGLPSPEEPGFDPVSNPDPSGDDYCPLTNPEGTEGNAELDEGEDFNGNGKLEVNLQAFGQSQAAYYMLTGKIITGLNKNELLLLMGDKCR